MNSFGWMKYPLIILAIAAYILVNRYEYVSVGKVNVKIRVDRIGIEPACVVPALPFYSEFRWDSRSVRGLLGNNSNLEACKNIGPSYFH